MIGEYSTKYIWYMAYYKCAMKYLLAGFLTIAIFTQSTKGSAWIGTHEG